jgi:hypothetical protein
MAWVPSAGFQPLDPGGGHKVGRLFADHDRRRVDVAADDGRQNGGVGDAQALDATHAQPIVDHRLRIGAHAAGADRMLKLLADATWQYTAW